MLQCFGKPEPWTSSVLEVFRCVYLWRHSTATIRRHRTHQACHGTVKAYPVPRLHCPISFVRKICPADPPPNDGNGSPRFPWVARFCLRLVFRNLWGYPLGSILAFPAHPLVGFLVFLKELGAILSKIQRLQSSKSTTPATKTSKDSNKHDLEPIQTNHV